MEKFLSRTVFTSQEDYIRNFRIRVPADFNFAYDVVDAYAAEEPDKKALLWTDDRGGEIQFTFADMKRETDRTASYFQSLGIGRGDMVMLILKRRYEFWFSILALHKLGAVAIPATHLLTRKDVVYRCNMAGVKAIVAAGAGDNRPYRRGHAGKPYHEAADKRRPRGSRRVPRFPRGHPPCSAFRAAAACEHQRRHHADVFHLRHDGRTEDGRPLFTKYIQ